MNRRQLLLGLMPIAVTVLGFPADAQDRGSWFKSLKQPGSGFSCCDISDCKRTEADWRGGQWWAVVSGDPPRDRADKRSIDGDAYVCSSRTAASTARCRT
jgi:hypothetical protein